MPRTLHALVMLIVLAACQPAAAQFSYDVPYVPTPHVVVEEMLRLAAVGPSDFVMDLGSGDAAGNAAGNGSGMLDLGSQEPASAEPIVSGDEPSTPSRKPHSQPRREAQSQGAPAKKPQSAPKPQPQAKANGKASGNGGLEVSGDGKASANADASADANATVDK